jgi:hypothetical protein
MILGQGMAEDVTFYDLDRDIAGIRTCYNEDRDAEAWQDKDEDRDAGN